MKSIALLAICMMCVTIAAAQDSAISQKRSNLKWGISTNALADLALLSPNLKGTLYIGKNSAVSIGGSYGWWGLNWKKSLQQWSVSAGYDYYFKKDYSFTGHHIGIAMQTGQYELRNDNIGRRGHWATVGATYGYTWALNWGSKNNWYLDAGLGLGYMYRFYHKFYYEAVGDTHAECCIGHKAKHAFAPTNANVSFIYRF